jgi:hypothetical protein
MREVKGILNRIADNTRDLGGILERQGRVMNEHFTKAALDREMAEYYTEQHREWQKFAQKEGIKLAKRR